MESAANVIGVLGEAGSRSLRPVPRNLDPVRRWLLELDHLRAVLGDNWGLFDLDDVLEWGPSAPARNDVVEFGRRLGRYVTAVQASTLGESARALIDVNGYGDERATVAALESALEVLIGDAPRMTSRLSPSDQAQFLRLLPAVAAIDAARLTRGVGELLARLRALAADEVRETIDVILLESGVTLDELTEAWFDDIRRAAQPIEEATSPTSAQGAAYVNIGVTPGYDPTATAGDRLIPDTLHWIWVEIGPRRLAAVPGHAEAIRAGAISAGDEVEVVLFADDGIEVSPTPAVGRVRMQNGAAFTVTAPAIEFTSDSGIETDSRLWFGVRTPSKSGSWRIRCALFVRDVLLHVEQLTLVVGDDGARNSVRTTYRVVRDLSSDAGFDSLLAPKLTIYANAGDDTHDFSFYAPGDREPAVHGQFSLRANNVVAILRTAREALGQVSFGAREYTHGARSKHTLIGGYFTKPGDAEKQLIALAQAGSDLWLQFATEIDRRTSFNDDLRKVMGRPGTVQLAVKESPELVVPLQLLYDRPVEATTTAGVSVCDSTRTWLSTPNGDPPCLSTPCPNADDRNRVCIAGFWGFRHVISTSLSNPNDCEPGLSTAISLPAPGRPAASAAVAVDDSVRSYWRTHRMELDQWVTLPEEPAGTSDEALARLKQDPPTIAYFLAHVVYERSKPRIQLQPQPAAAIDAGRLNDANLSLCRPRTLVFLNACESAGLDPDRMLGLVDRFFIAGAGAVVGTEITVFVDFATKFAEAFIAAYANGTTLGAAMRSARIAMLALRNPLGLAYSSYGLHDVRLVVDPVVQPHLVTTHPD